MKKKHLAFAILLNLLESPSFAEEPSEKLKDKEFIIEKERVIVLPEQEPISEAISVTELLKLDNPKINFAFRNIDADLGLLPSGVKMLRDQGEIAEKFYSSYIKLGHSTTPSPLLEFGYARDYDALCNYGLHVKHSSRGFGFAKGYFQDYKNAIKFFAEKYFQNGILIDLKAALEYDKFSFHQPSANNNSADNRRIFSPGVFFRLRNFDDALFKYQALGELYRVSMGDNFNESALVSSLNLDYSFDRGHKISSKTDISISKYQNSQNSEGRFSINTLLVDGFFWREFGLKYGATLNVDNDLRRGGGISLNTICPTLGVEYNYEQWLNPYCILIEAENRAITLRELVRKNVFVKDDVTLINQRGIKLGDLGVQGIVLNGSITYKIGATLRRYDQFLHFINLPNHGNKFQVGYSPMTLWTPYLALSSKLWGDSLSANLDLSAFSPVFSHYLGPSFAGVFSTRYRVMERWLLSGGLEVLAGHRGDSSEGGAIKPIDLAAVVDAKIAVDYLYSERWTIFGSLDNLLDRPNIKFHSTRPSGIRFTAGAVLSLF